MEHVGTDEDFHTGYRSRSETEPWFEKDQVERLGGLLEVGVRQRIEATAEGIRPGER